MHENRQSCKLHTDTRKMLRLMHAQPDTTWLDFDSSLRFPQHTSTHPHILYAHKRSFDAKLASPFQWVHAVQVTRHRIFIVNDPLSASLVERTLTVQYMW